MQQLYTAIIPISLLIIVGFIVQKISNKKHPLLAYLDKVGIYTQNNWSYRLNEYVLYLALPAMIFQSLTETSIKFVDAVYPLQFTIYTSLFFLAILYFYARIVYKHDEKSKNTLVLCGFFGNVAYIGFPFILKILPNASPLISLVIGIHILIVFTVVLSILEKHKNSEKSFLSSTVQLVKQPVLVSILLALLATQYEISLPNAVTHTISMLGNTAGPVVLIALGAFFAEHTIQNADLQLVKRIVVSKLFIFPLTLYVVSLFSMNKIGITVPILESAMPVAITVFALSDRFHLDKKTVATSILVSTILSIITLPAISFLLL